MNLIEQIKLLYGLPRNSFILDIRSNEMESLTRLYSHSLRGIHYDSGRNLVGCSQGFHAARGNANWGAIVSCIKLLEQSVCIHPTEKSCEQIFYQTLLMFDSSPRILLLTYDDGYFDMYFPRKAADRLIYDMMHGNEDSMNIILQEHRFDE